MKRILIALALVKGCATCLAFSVTLCWDRSADTNATNYVVRAGATSGHWDREYPAGDNSVLTIPDLPPMTAVYFVVFARDDSTGLESDPSNEVGIPVWPVINLQVFSSGACGNLPTMIFSQIETNKTFVVEFCDDLDSGHWFYLGECRGNASAVSVVDPVRVDKRFYRGKLNP